jgi:hypothetical protein
VADLTRTRSLGSSARRASEPGTGAEVARRAVADLDSRESKFGVGPERAVGLGECLKWRGRRKNETDDGWLAGRFLDEALRVFGALETATCADGGRLDDRLRELLHMTALDLLDDVACLASVVMTAPSWPPWPHDPPPELTPPADESPTVRAVEALGTYTQRLTSVALLLAHRRDDTATVFARLAAAAEARIEVLAS